VPTVAVNPPKTPVTKGSMGISAATVPNVCKMPGPPAPFVPVPLPNIGKSSDSPSGYSTTVKIEGNAVAIKGATFKSMGDIASKGTGGGIVSANTHGPTEFVAPGSLNVKIEGKNVHLLTDAMVNNCGSPPNAATTPGVVQAPNVVLPVLEFDSAEFPEKTKNMQNRMPPNNERTLTRQTSRKKIRANRRAALANATPGGAGTSLDEFPFASSTQGGANASVTPIDVHEQNKQGGKMSGFYRKHKIKNGQSYIVRII
jgi:uncharacterized Zn-binding protein involved in type VI secretion